MTFSILFWNVWYLNQIEDGEKLNQLLQELQKLTDEHQPDFVALNEVVQPQKDKTPPVIEHLQKLGYTYSHQTKMDHIGKYWMSGVVLCSKVAISDKQNPIISKNGSAARYGYPGIDKEVISTTTSLPKGPTVKIIVAHPSAIIDSPIEHRAGMKSLEKLIRSDEYSQNTILVGDFNQWRLIPRSFRHKVTDVMDSRTGSILYPTWRHDAHRFTPLRLNLDYIYWSRQSDFYLKDFKILSSAVSDHAPLLITFVQT